MAHAKALHIHLEAKPGKQAEVQRLLEDILAIVKGESATSPWFGVRMTETVFGIFEAFPDESGRETHLTGKGAEILEQRGKEILVQPARIDKLDVVAEK